LEIREKIHIFAPETEKEGQPMADAAKEITGKSASMVRDAVWRDYGASLDDDTLWDVMCSAMNAA
jgi:hypothetical protein